MDFIEVVDDSNDTNQDIVPELNTSYKPCSISFNNKKRKSIEVIQVSEDSNGNDSKKFRQNNNSKENNDILIEEVCSGVSSELASLHEDDVNVNQCDNDQLIDNVWDNFGDQNQFDEYYDYEKNMNSKSDDDLEKDQLNKTNDNAGTSRSFDCQSHANLPENDDLIAGIYIIV